MVLVNLLPRVTNLDRVIQGINVAMEVLPQEYRPRDANVGLGAK